MQFGFGSGLVWGLRNDITGTTPVRVGALQDVQIDFDGEIKELYGQYQFALDVARGKTKITGKAKFAQLSGNLFNTMFFGQTLTTGSTTESIGELGTVPSSTTYTVTVTNGATFAQDLGCYYQLTGLPLTRVTVTPTLIGTYMVSNVGVYTFSAADASAKVAFDYSYTVTTGTTITLGNPLMGITPKLMLTFTEQYGNQNLTLILYSCVSSKLTMPTKIDDYIISELDFSAQANPANLLGSLSMSAP